MGVMDKFLNYMKLNDEEDDFYDDDYYDEPADVKPAKKIDEDILNAIKEIYFSDEDLAE